MKPFVRLALATVLLSTAVASSALANTTRDAANSIWNDAVRTREGNCVRTRWTDDSDPCGTPSPVVAPKAPRVVTKEHNRAYLVFFDFDSAGLTDVSSALVKDILDQTKSAQKTKYALVGHTDLSGSNAYNLKLSQKRADAVKAVLVKHGVSADHIKASWVGESEPLVPTEDGIKEPQNRRVEIKVYTETVEVQR